jgi:hypothetical protein
MFEMKIYCYNKCGVFREELNPHLPKAHICSHGIDNECSQCPENEKGWMNGLKFKFKPKKYIHHAKYNQ